MVRLEAVPIVQYITQLRFSLEKTERNIEH